MTVGFVGSVRNLPGWVEAVIIGIGSRLLALAALTIAWATGIPAPLGPPSSSPIIIWDSQWYIRIATQGYHAVPVIQTGFGTGYHDFAFFPLYPGLIAALSLGGRLPVEIVAPAISNVLFVLALIPIRIVLERAFDRRIGRFGLLLFAFSPAAYVYSLAYSEPVFLVIAGLFFVTNGPVKGFVLGVLAGISRLAFGALAAASLADLVDPRTRLRGFAAVGGMALGFGAWWVYISILTQDFWGYMLGIPYWHSTDSPTGAPTGLASILAVNHPIVVITVTFSVVIAIGSLALFRRGEYRLGLYSAACFAMSWLTTWSSMPRLFALAFPAFAALAAILPTDRVRWLMVGISAQLMCALRALAVAGFVP